MWSVGSLTTGANSGNINGRKRARLRQMVSCSRGSDLHQSQNAERGWVTGQEGRGRVCLNNEWRATAEEGCDARASQLA